MLVVPNPYRYQTLLSDLSKYSTPVGSQGCLTRGFRSCVRSSETVLWTGWVKFWRWTFSTHAFKSKKSSGGCLQVQQSEWNVYRRFRLRFPRLLSDFSELTPSRWWQLMARTLILSGKQGRIRITLVGTCACLWVRFGFRAPASCHSPCLEMIIFRLACGRDC